MAFRDGDGTILIDDVAAENDVSKLNAALEKLEEAIAFVNQMIVLNSEMSGPSATAIEEAALTFKTQLEIQKTNIETTIENIRGTVRKYHTLDAELSNRISGSSMGG